MSCPRGLAAISPRPAPGAGRCTSAASGFVDTPSYARDRLAPGLILDGPAIVEQSDATPLIAPGFRARVDAGGHILLERTSG